MPQEFQVLQCYNCEIFQVDIVKKVSKWSCKVCGEKQSIKTIFDKGNGKHCRLSVQKLNEMRIKADSVEHRKQLSPVEAMFENEQRIIKNRSKSSVVTNSINNDEEYTLGNKVDKKEKREMLDHSILGKTDYKRKPEDFKFLNNKKPRISKWNVFLNSRDIKCGNEKLHLGTGTKKNTEDFQSSQLNIYMFELENEVLDDFLKL